MCYIRRKKLAKIKNVYIIKISINYHVELIRTKNYPHEKNTVNTYFVFKACKKVYVALKKIGTPM